MTPADRAAWLARVEGMTRSERIAALPSHMHYAHEYGQMASSSAAKLGESSSCYAVDAAHHANRALDLIAALERDAAAEALEAVRGMAEHDWAVTGYALREKLRRLRAEAARTEGV